MSGRELVYVRQSSPKQVETNRESADRPYALRRRAEKLGWRPEQIETVDEDQGTTGSGECERTGYEHLVYEVARGRVGAVLGLEVSRFARDAADFYRLLQWCRSTDTLVVEDAHVFSPKHHDDRCMLGIKGTVSERELFTIRDRMLQAARNKAARGELYHRVPIGYVREGAGLAKDPHEGIRHAIEAVFARFREQGTARQTAAALRDAGVKLPGKRHAGTEAEWSEASYSRVLQILTHPAMAGAYVYGRHRVETVLNASGRRTRRVRPVPMDEWRVLIEDHHEGYLSWGEWLEIRQQLAANRQRRGGPGAVREGRALLQGLAVCGHCGRAMTVRYRQAPVYMCRTPAVAGNARRVCQSLGGQRVDELVAQEFLEAITPAGVEAALRAERDWESRRKAELRSHELELQRCEYN